jgi:signal recognition particle subunit SRP54
MTKDERVRPEIIRGTRRARIAKGSGTSLQEVNALLKQFGQMREMMRSPHKMKNMMKAMSGGADSLDQLGDMKRGFGNIGGKRR